MIEKFLRAKHWQLFLLTFGLPMIFQIILMGNMISGISNGIEPGLDWMLNYLKLYPLIMIIFMGFYFGWFWSIGTGLDKIIPNELKLKVGKFKILLIIPLVYVFCISIFIGVMMSRMISAGGEPNPAIFVLIIPLHLFSIFCILYCLYFVAKTIKTAELKKKVSFGDFAGEFFLIWFFPIGIWFIQPKINKMIKDKDNGINSLLISD